MNVTMIGIDSDVDDSVQRGHFAETLFDGDYAPYPNKVVSHCLPNRVPSLMEDTTDDAPRYS